MINENSVGRSFDIFINFSMKTHGVLEVIRTNSQDKKQEN